MIKEVLWGIKEEPDTTGLQASVDFSGIDEDMTVKEEPFGEEQSSAIISTASKNTNKSQKNPIDSRCRESCNICS